MEATMEKKQIRSDVLKMIVPITAENILQMVVGFVSMALIGRMNPLVINAFGLGNRVNNILWSLFKGIGIGAQIVVAQAFGAKQEHSIAKTVQQTLLSVVFIGILVMGILQIAGTSVLSFLFSPEPELLKQASLALHILSLCLPFMAVVLVVGSILQGMGDSRTPLFIALFLNVINIIVSYLLIFGNFGFPKLGLIGATIGVVIAQGSAALLGLRVLFGKNGKLRCYEMKDFFVPDWTVIKKVYKLGFPSSLESLFWQFSTIILTRALLLYGNDTFAAYQLGLQAESLSFMPAAGFSVAATAFVGQHLGAKDPQKAKKYFKSILKGSAMISIVCASPLIFLSKGIMRILTPDETLIAIGSLYVFIMGFAQLPQNIAGVLSGALRGAGYTEMPMLSSGVGLWGVRVPMSLLIAYVWKLDVSFIFLVIGVDMVVRFLFNFVAYKKINIYERYKLVN